MTAALDERYADMRARFEQQLADVEAEIREAAVANAISMRFGAPFAGAGRRQLGDRVMAALCLREVIAAIDDAKEIEIDQERTRAEYERTVTKPKLELEAKARQAEMARRDHDQLVREALHRVGQSIQQVAKPDSKDIAFLRENTRYVDRYTPEGRIDQVLWAHDRKPWWREETKPKENRP